ncbi:hypothetical protein CDAR_477301 [Caerostris darwini]|uniref:Uncharacterized protein n=1 Tax=Caerostris darwini TaxID=1538125 RepID=A0AAV4U233_9ARAC|nr:hypothetical protein CDAR_477301 [Caerostris darwini]
MCIKEVLLHYLPNFIFPERFCGQSKLNTFESKGWLGRENPVRQTWKWMLLKWLQQISWDLFMAMLINTNGVRPPIVNAFQFCGMLDCGSFTIVEKSLKYLLRHPITMYTMLDIWDKMGPECNNESTPRK